MRRFDRIVGIAVTTASAVASTGLYVWILRTPTQPGDVTWPTILVASVSMVCGWMGVWAWAQQRWALAAPTVFLGAVGAVALASFLVVIPVGFAVLALCRAIRGRVRTA